MKTRAGGLEALSDGQNPAADIFAQSRPSDILGSIVFFFFEKGSHDESIDFVVPLKNVVSSMADPSQIVLSHHYM